MYKNYANYPLMHWYVCKVLLIMRLTALLVILTVIEARAAASAQKITISEKNAALKKVFREIRKQSSYDFLYTDQLLQNAKPVSIEMNSADIVDVLDQIFKNQPLTYIIDEKTIVIKAKPDNTVVQAQIADTTITVTGRIVDSKGVALPGATIKVNRNIIAITGIDGSFNLPHVSEGKLVQISFVGFLPKEVTAAPKLGNIILEEKNRELDEAHVIAYGKESRRFSIGSTASVNAAEIAQQPVGNVLQALQGRVPGLMVSPASGQPGALISLQVRGQNTLSGIIDPLYIIDGVPFTAQSIALGGVNSGGDISQLGVYARPAAQGSSQNYSFGAMNSINPNDIESISILKDADATSIYGSMGSNGVVIITTKKGKAGKDELDVSVNSGYNSAARPVQLLNTQQYLKVRQDAFNASGETPDSSTAPDLKVFDPNKYTNWEKTILGNTTHHTDMHVSLSGGSDNNTYLLTGGYTRSDFMLPGDYADRRLSFHSAFHHQSQDKRLTIDFGADYSYDRNNIPDGAFTPSILIPPNTPNLLDPAGNLIWNYKGFDLTGLQFYNYTKETHLLSTYNLLDHFNITYKLAPGLNMGINAGYSRNDVSEILMQPSSSLSPLYLSYGLQSNSEFSATTLQTINIEPQLNYSRTIGKGELTALLGGTYRKDNSYENQQQGYGYSSDLLLGSIGGATTKYAYDLFNIHKYVAGFARVNYIYDQEYIISLSGRRDGSSYFGPDYQFGNFGSAGLGWIFSEEEKFKQALPFISYAKISGNYGTSGSDGYAAYLYQSFYSSYSPGLPQNIPTFQGTSPLFAYNLYNPYFHWSTKKSLNLGLDLGFWKDRLLANVTYYRNREDNQLTQQSLSSQTGFYSFFGNTPAIVQNTGWELTLNSKNIITKDFSWSSNFNITLPNNKLIAFPNLAQSYYYGRYAIGSSTTMAYLVKYKDVNPTTGLFEFYTANGQVTSNPNMQVAQNGGDMTSIVDLQPKFFGGFGNTFTYKRFSLSAYFQFSKQTAPNYLSSIYSGLYGPGSALLNMPVQVLNNYWTQPGDHSQLQRLVTNTASSNAAYATASNAFAQSTGVYSDDTYLRLKTLALSYNLPDRFLKGLGIKNFKAYMNVQNLLTFTDYKVGDPEIPGGFASAPIQRTLVFGLSFNL
jgi:TonB-dependent starch-binding outer membrane protein SusC